jgi:hypothetical protein
LSGIQTAWHIYSATVTLTFPKFVLTDFLYIYRYLQMLYAGKSAAKLEEEKQKKKKLAARAEI